VTSVALTAFAVSFLYIALKATQQRQVMLAQYLRMPPVSFAMAYCEVFLTGSIAYSYIAHGLWHAFVMANAIGAGGALGSVVGTYLHKRKHG
jgi:hypothetical protein